MKGIPGRLLILLSLAAVAGCATYPDRYIAAGPGGVDCRSAPCTRDGYTYWSSSGYGHGYAGGWHGSGTVWYGSSRWHAPYRPGYTAWGFRDPWYDPWRDPWWGAGWAWAPPSHAGWHGHGRSRWTWSIGYGWSSGPWSGSLWYRPWWQPVWHGPGWHGGGWYGSGWSSTWHRPYRGHRPPPRERTVDWRPADGIGVASPRWLPAAEEAQRIADRSRAGARSWTGSAAPVEERLGSSDPFVRGDGEPMRVVELEDAVRHDRRPGRLMPRGAAEGWIAPMPGSRPPARERGSDDGAAVDAARPARWDLTPSRFETPEPIRGERPTPGRFARGEAGRFDPSPSRFETPEEPVGYERPMPGRFARPEPARFDPPPQRFEAPEPPRYERPMPEPFEPVRVGTAPRFEPPQPTRREALDDPEPRLDSRRFDRADFEPR